MNSNFCLWIISVAAAIVGAPLLIGIINRTKAFFAGRHGAPFLQLYWDIFRLLKKSSIQSSTACGLIRLSPVVNVAIALMLLLLLPLGMVNSPLSFTGDIILFLYLMGTMRFITVLGALDSGSSFEGMGASREVQFSILAELAIFAIVIFMCLLTGKFTINGMLNSADSSCWTASGCSMLLVAIACFIVMLCENCRVPFDDPETHLELTMIHEAMVLDNGGPDLALIHYGAALKIWLFAAFLVSLVMPCELVGTWLGGLIHLAGILLISLLIGITESIQGRYRFFKVPQMLVSAFCMAVAAIMLFLLFHD